MSAMKLPEGLPGPALIARTALALRELHGCMAYATLILLAMTHRCILAEGLQDRGKVA